MSLLHVVAAAVGCLFMQQPLPICVTDTVYAPTGSVAGVESNVPLRTGPALDVVLTSEAAFAWDLETGEVLYEKNADAERPVASLSKLLTTLTARSRLAIDAVVEIPQAARRPQLLGSNVQLPIGQSTTVRDLLAASLIASANDAAVTLATAVSGSEEAFVETANAYAQTMGLPHTRLANATGFSGGDQHSTAREVGMMLEKAYDDTILGPFLSQDDGVLMTQTGTRRAYKSTNKLLGTYLPVLAAKTGYTNEAGENLAIITKGDGGQLIGVVVLGSGQRFQDAKVLTEWIWRNWTWASND